MALEKVLLGDTSKKVVDKINKAIEQTNTYTGDNFSDKVEEVVEKLGLGEGTVTDVQVDGRTVLEGGVAKITMPIVPTKTSDLTNDSGFAKTNDLPVKGVKVNDTNVVGTSDKIAKIKIAEGDGITVNTGEDGTVTISSPDLAGKATDLELSIDSSTYVVTAQLKAGETVLATQTIDLPLESVVVSGSYDSANKKVVLTLQNGNKVEFSVEDLVSGLVSNSGDLPADEIVVGNGNSNVKTSGAKIAKSEIGVTDSDVLVPTSKAVQSYVEKALEDALENVKTTENVTATKDFDSEGNIVVTKSNKEVESSNYTIRDETSVDNGSVHVNSIPTENTVKAIISKHARAFNLLVDTNYFSYVDTDESDLAINSVEYTSLYRFPYHSPTAAYNTIGKQMFLDLAKDADGVITFTIDRSLQNSIHHIVMVNNTANFEPDTTNNDVPFAYTYSVGLTYSLNSDSASYSVTGIGDCNDKTIFIPLTYDGLPVIRIGEHSFSGADKTYEKVVLSKNISAVLPYAFKLSPIKTLVINGASVNIMDEACYGCENLTEINFEKVNSINERAFYGCSNLNELNYYGSYIGTEAFRNSGLKKVNLYKSNSYETANLQFYNCKSLSEVNIMSDEYYIKSKMFGLCTNLTTLLLPKYFTIHDNSFEGCVNINCVYYKGTPDNWDNLTIKGLNGTLKTATRYYYSETQPTDTTNKYWRYVDGVPTPW